VSLNTIPILPPQRLVSADSLHMPLNLFREGHESNLTSPETGLVTQTEILRGVVLKE